MKIAIVGAGFSGLSVAWYFQQYTDCKITLFERKEIGGGASGVAAGLMHPYVGEQGRRTAFASKGINAAKELIAIAEEKLGQKVVVQSGIIRYVQNEKQHRMFLSHCQAFGDVNLHSASSFFIQSGMTIDCLRYLEGLWRAVAEKGAKLIVHEVVDLNSLKGFDLIVVTAGAGSRHFPELKSLNISILKGQVLKCYASQTVELPKASSICKGYVALSQDPQICYVGSTYQRGDFTDDPQPDLVKEELFPKISFFFPSVIDLKVVECRAAFRVVRLNHYLPIASRVEKNIWVLTAMGSRGLLYHAYFGKNLVNEILNSN
jgi:glycine/D-amino acid oxidase-like deaminating enzyme